MNTSRQRAAAIDDSLLLHHEAVKISKEAKKRKATDVGNESSTIRNPRVLPVKKCYLLINLESHLPAGLLVVPMIVGESVVLKIVDKFPVPQVTVKRCVLITEGYIVGFQMKRPSNRLYFVRSYFFCC